MYSNLNYETFDRKTFLVLAGSSLISATLVVVMVSLPFLLLSMNISFAYMGVIEAIGLLTNYGARIPAKVYVERNGGDAGIAAGLIAMGVSMTFLYLTRNFALIVGAIFLINTSFTLFHYGIRPKLSAGLQAVRDERLPSTYHIFNAFGPFAGLVLAGLYTGGDIRPVYGGISVILLFAGVLSLFVLMFNKPPKNTKPLSVRFNELVMKPLKAFTDMGKIREREFLLVLTVIHLVTTLSIGSVIVFFPAMAIEDGLSRPEIFFLFAAVGIASFALRYVGRIFTSDLMTRAFFLIRPLFLFLTLILMSMGYDQLLFMAAYSITGIWYLLEPGSERFAMSKFDDGDPEKMVYLASIFSRPVAIIAPLLGAILWFASPRLLFAVAIFPVLIALLLSHLIVNRPEVFRSRAVHDA